MIFRHLLFLTMLFSVNVLANDRETELMSVGAVIDSFHDAAAHGDKARYLDQLSDDAVFMGTDEWERWPKHPDFVAYVNSRFRDGSGWTYQSVERTINISESSDIAWFDEVIVSEPNGRFRGTGVLRRQDGKWKIAHYAMSFLILNENWDDVVELARKTRETKE